MYLCITLIYTMLIAKTPFQLLQSKDKQRKLTLFNRIQKLQLAKRTISYTAKTIDSKYLKQVEMKQKINCGNIAMNNSIKKSYYFRRLLNKSMDTHLSPQEFVKMKNKFDKININDISCQNKSIEFKEIRQSQNERYLRSSQERYIDPSIIEQRTVQNKSNDKIKNASHLNQKTIIEIAQERRTNVQNLELTILGNKQSINAKDNLAKGKDRIKMNANSEKKQNNQTQMSHPNDLNTKGIDHQQQYNYLFKQFEEQKQQRKDQNKNLFIPKFCSNNNEHIYYNLKKIKLKEYQSDYEPIHLTCIQRSQRPTTTAISLSKSYKPSTSKQKRSILLTSKRSRLPIFINDIKGWIVGQQNEYDVLDNFYH